MTRYDVWGSTLIFLQRKFLLVEGDAGAGSSTGLTFGGSECKLSLHAFFHPYLQVYNSRSNKFRTQHVVRVGTDGIRDPHASGGGRDVCSGNTGKRISIIPLNCGERIR